ncbi:MAG: aldo/keto reductase [Deltaproteobacteria bacterium]|nr:MAG: aldo/keto reductase [Deltaproteobacteria bacterium]
MLKREFGPARVPVIGQGTWRLRGPEAVDALRTGIELGLTHIDTAELYGTEEMVAQAIEGRRDEIFLVSKVLPSNATREGTVRACEQSLQRLRTDRLDCYLLHWPGPHPLEDTIAAFEELRAADKIRSYGVSNFDVEARVLPACREFGAVLVGYSPFDNLPEGGELAAVAVELHATRRQVALAFLVRLPGTFAIPKASTVEHVRENAGGASLKLTERQIARLERAYPVHVRSELPTS